MLSYKYLPYILEGSRSPYCRMRVALANALFGMTCMAPLALIQLCFLTGYLIRRCKTGQDGQGLFNYVQKGARIIAIISAVMKLLGFATFFYASQMLWVDFNSSYCLSGWNLYDFMLWMGILAYTLGPALLVGLGLLCMCCFAPCLFKYIMERATE